MTSASASRVTRSSRSLRLAILLFAGVAAGVSVLRAQETPPAPPADTTAAPTQPVSAPPTTDPAEGGPAAAEPAKPAGSPTPAAPSPGRFEPTEKVRADFDVSFPIDI